MDLENYEALQIVPSFNLGLDDLFENTRVRDNDIALHLATMRLMLPKLSSSLPSVTKQLRTKMQVRKIGFKRFCPP